MATATAVIGVLVALVLVVILLMKGWGPEWLVWVIIGVVCLTNGMNYLETLSSIFLPSTFNNGQFLVGLMIFGAILGYIYTESGAMLSISRALCRGVLRDSDGMGKRQMKGVLIIAIVCAALVLGGVSVLATIFTILAFVYEVAEQCNLPRRHLIGILSIGTSSWTQSMPWAPTAGNVMASQYLGTNPSSSWVAGVVGVVVIWVVSIIGVSFLLKRSRAKGEKYEPLPDLKKWDEDRKLPNPIVSLIPLLVVFVLYNLGLDVVLSLMVGCVLAGLFWWKDIRRAGAIQLFNKGAIDAISGLFTTIVMIGFGSVMVTTPGFTWIVDQMGKLSMPPLILMFFIMLVLCAFCGNNTGGMSIFLEKYGLNFVNNYGVPAAAMHRASMQTCLITDSLPTSGAFIFFSRMMKCTIAESYPAAFCTTTLATGIAALVVNILLTIVPNLP